MYASLTDSLGIRVARRLNQLNGMTGQTIEGKGREGEEHGGDNSISQSDNKSSSFRRGFPYGEGVTHGRNFMTDWTD